MMTRGVVTADFLKAIEETDVIYAIEAALIHVNSKMAQAAECGSIEAAKIWARVGDHLQTARDDLIPF